VLFLRSLLPFGYSSKTAGLEAHEHTQFGAHEARQGKRLSAINREEETLRWPIRLFNPAHLMLLNGTSSINWEDAAKNVIEEAENICASCA
jgi:hypothetical protein